MKFLELELNNFGPYKGEQKVQFPTDSQRRVMVVYGDNMRGKTSLLNALRWALYGKALDRLSRELDTTKLVNTEAQRENDWKVCVRLRFEADGDEYELARSVQPLDLVSVPQSKRDFGHRVLLRKNGHAVQGDRIEAQIDRFIPEEVSRFYLFDAELLQEYETLLVEENAQGERIKNAIEQILGVPALISGRNELRDLLKRAQNLQAKESRHVQALESQSAQSLRLQDEIESHERDLSKLREQLTDITEKIDACDAELASTRSVQDLHRRQQALDEELRRCSERRRELEKERFEVLRSAWRDLLQPRLELQRADVSRKLHNFGSEIKRRGGVEERIRVIRHILEQPSCPTCGGIIDETKRAGFGAQLGELLAQINQFDASMAAVGTLTQELNALSRITSTVSVTALRRIDRDLSQTSIAETGSEGELETLKEQLKGHDIARIAQIAKEKEGYLKIKGRLEGSIEALMPQLEEKRAKVRQLSVLMTKNPEGRKQRSSREVEVYSGIERVFAESIATFRECIRDRVAAASTEAFHHLTTESTYSGLRINENYGLTILDRHGAEVNVRSAGAEQIVALSLLSALNKTANRSGPVVIDTPFGRLDPRHRLNIMRFVPNMAEQVVFLVHEGEVNRSSDLEPIMDNIGCMYEIQRITSSHSVIARI